MYLIDIGNSYAKIYNQGEVQHIETQNIISWLTNNYTKDIYICSVVPRQSSKIKKLFPNIKFLDSNIYDKLINITSEQIYKKGSDRIILGYGARRKYNKNLIVIDMGTCITLDTYTNDEYKSGYIFPGLELLRSGLYEKVPHLPMPLDTTKAEVDSIDTTNQILWGNVYGAIGAINQFVCIEKKRHGIDFDVVISGGTISSLDKFLTINKLDKNELFNFNFIVDENLIFESMEKIIEKDLI